MTPHQKPLLQSCQPAADQGARGSMNNAAKSGVNSPSRDGSGILDGAAEPPQDLRFSPFPVPHDDSRHRDCAFTMSAATRTSRFAHSPSCAGAPRTVFQSSKLGFARPALSFAGLRRWSPRRRLPELSCLPCSPPSPDCVKTANGKHRAPPTNSLIKPAGENWLRDRRHSLT